MNSAEALADYLESEVNPWIWKDYHKRGAFSHYIRTRKLSASSSDEGWAAVWANIGINQTMSLMSTTIFLEVSQEARSQKDYADNLHPDLKDEIIPLGSLSPLGTEAGLDALLHVAELSYVGSHFKNVTYPFLVATCKEALTLLMSYLVLIAPIVFAWRQYRSGSGFTDMAILLTLAVAIVSVFVSLEFKRMFRLLV